MPITLILSAEAKQVLLQVFPPDSDLEIVGSTDCYIVFEYKPFYEGVAQTRSTTVRWVAIWEVSVWLPDGVTKQWLGTAAAAIEQPKKSRRRTATPPPVAPAVL